MEIVNEYPPVYDRAAEAFPLSGREIFAYGDKIFNPDGLDVPIWLVEHEKVHQVQQAEIGGPEAWWDKYLVDEQFRFDQEKAAHQKEYRVYCQHNRDRNQRFRYRMIVARKLAAPLYGSLLTTQEAMGVIK